MTICANKEQLIIDNGQLKIENLGIAYGNDYNVGATTCRPLCHPERNEVKSKDLRSIESAWILRLRICDAPLRMTDFLFLLK